MASRTSFIIMFSLSLFGFIRGIFSLIYPFTNILGAFGGRDDLGFGMFFLFFIVPILSLIVVSLFLGLFSYYKLHQNGLPFLNSDLIIKNSLRLKKKKKK